jgi:hypothetical protein
MKVKLWKNLEYKNHSHQALNTKKIESLLKVSVSGIALNKLCLDDTHNKKQCNHKKIYAQEILCSIPPQRKWICELCGEEGIERIGSINDYIDNYKIVKEQFAKSKTQWGQQ